MTKVQNCKDYVKENITDLHIKAGDIDNLINDFDLDETERAILIGYLYTNFEVPKDRIKDTIREQGYWYDMGGVAVALIESKGAVYIDLLHECIKGKKLRDLLQGKAKTCKLGEHEAGDSITRHDIEEGLYDKCRGELARYIEEPYTLESLSTLINNKKVQAIEARYGESYVCNVLMNFGQ